MGPIHYNLIEYVLVYYDGDGESVEELRILRSRSPKALDQPPHGISVKDWIDANEELVTRIIFQDSAWTVSAWESSFYISEIESYGLNMGAVVTIKRVISYELR
jgi:hypothetical protein